MIFTLNTNSTDPAYNLALEQYLLESGKGEYFYFWRNEKAVIVGKNQNTISEIDVDFVRRNGIKVVRRLSGGGAVFHDLGNINYTYIGDYKKGDFIDFKKYTRPIIEVLSDLGLTAELSGRNDLLIDGCKFSGNAQYIKGDRLLHHGTLLYSARLDSMQGALLAKPEKFTGKAAKSVRSRVVNLADKLSEPVDTEIFLEILRDGVARRLESCVETALSDDDVKMIETIAAERYMSWDWNFGSSPGYAFGRAERTAAGTVELQFDVRKGLISGVKIYGDYFGEKDVSELERALEGKKHERGEIEAALLDLGTGDYISGLSGEALADMFF